MKPNGWIGHCMAVTLLLFALHLLTPTSSQHIHVPQRPTSKPEPTLPPVVVAVETPVEVIAEKENKTKIVLTGIPQIDYIHDPNLPSEVRDFDLSEYPFYKRVPANIDETNFTCDGRFDGFYASIPHKCQVYHNCLFGIRYDFLCPNYTAFDQSNLICHYYSVVDCERSDLYFHRNEYLYIDPTTTTPAAPEVRIVYIERPHPRERPANRPRLGNRRRTTPAPADDYYYDYVDETPVAKEALPQTNNALDQDYYYYDEPVRPTTARPLRRRRPQRQRPRRPPQSAIHTDRFIEELPAVAPPQNTNRNRLAGKLTHEELGLPSTEAPVTVKVIERLAGKLTDEELGIIPPSEQSQRLPINEGPRRRRPQRRRRRKKTTTTTAAPEYEYYDDEYYDYYEDEPSSTTTTTARPNIIRRRKGRPVKRPRLTPEERRQSLLKAKKTNAQFPSRIQPTSDSLPATQSQVDIPQENHAANVEITHSQRTFTEGDEFVEEEVPTRLGQRRPGENPPPNESIFTTNEKVIAEHEPARRQGSFRRPSNGGGRRSSLQVTK